MDLVLIALLAAVLTLALVAVVAALWGGPVLRRFRADATADREATVAAAVDAVTRQAATAFAQEREASLRAAVDTVTTVASSKLGDHMDAGREQMDLRARSFEEQVDHIGTALTTLGTAVQDLQRDRAAQTGSIVEQLQQVAATQRSLADHTQDLRAALASPKQRGQWGERMAEDVLAAAGMREGINYRRQAAVAGGTVPDFTFLLPQGLEVRMDVKFPIDNYLRVAEADTDVDRARFTKAFRTDVRSRIRELRDRGYVDARDTVDCLLLFIPNEAVFAFLHEADPEVVDVALGHQVVLCSPSSLFAVLAVIRRSVEQFRLERTSDEILRCLSGVTDEWVKFTGSLDKVARQLDTVTRSFHDEVNGTRRRVLQKSLDEIDALQEHGGDVATPGERLVAEKSRGDVRALPFGADDRDDAGDDGDVPAAG